MAGGPAALFIVATPIGNLGDMSTRALKTLQEVDLIAAEDTRRAGQLLAHFGISGKQVVSYYDHVEAQKSEPLILRIKAEGLTLALISDAGTPCISDPGYRLVEAARRHEVAVHPIPGPSAVATLISASGLPSDRFLFVGFLPVKAGALRREINSWRQIGASIVFYEAPRRLAKTFDLIAEIYPMATVCVGRELTKLHEEIVKMPISAAHDWCLDPNSQRGEAVVMVYPGVTYDEQMLGDENGAIDEQTLVAQARQAYQQGLTLKDLLERYKDCGFSRSDLYRLLLSAKVSEPDSP